MSEVPTQSLVLIPTLYEEAELCEHEAVGFIKK